VADFKGMLTELAKGRGNLDQARAFIDEACVGGSADPADLLAQVEGAALPGPVANLLRKQIGKYTGETTNDPNKTVVDFNMTLAPTGAEEKTQVIAGEERTQVIDNGGNADRTVVMDSDRTVVTDSDRTQQSGGAGAGDFDPFAADSQRTQNNTGSTGGTAWPGRGAGGVQKQIGPGTILKDRFELISPLGEGGMGVVYKARDLLKVEAKDKNPYIAVKLLSGDFRNHPESFIALQRESSKAQRLAHPNIATVFDFDRDSGTVYMTMEILEGQELAKYIKKLPAGGLPVDEALRVIHQLSDGLMYAHQRGLVHSDFKPGNAFILNDGSVKIMDFGIARASKTKADAAGETTVFDPGQLGALTPAYATVEMFEGADPAPPDDIYALACVAYELLGGKHPFNKLSAPKVLEKGLVPAPIQKQGWTKRQNRGLMKALALKREDRTQSVEEFWESIKQKKDYTLQFTLGGVALAALIGFAGYRPIKEGFEDKRNNQIIESVKAGGAKLIPEVLAQLDNYDDRSRTMILEGAKDDIIAYFQDQASAQANQSRGLYNYAAAIKIVDDASKYYPDSAKLEAIKAELARDKDALVLALSNEYNEFLKNKATLLPQDARDMTDVLTTLKGVEPTNQMLTNAQMTKAYAEIIDDQIKVRDYKRADEILDLVLVFAPKDASLLGLNDTVQRELKRQADAQLVADVKKRLTDQRAGLTTVDAFAKARDDLLKLNELRPEDPLIAELNRPLLTAIDAGVSGAVATKNWEQAEKLVLDYAQLLAVPDLIARRDALSKAEVGAGWAPTNQTAQTAQVEERRKKITDALAAGKFDAEMDNTVLRAFKELAALMRPGNAWFEETRGAILNAYLTRANKYMDEDRYDAARVALESGERFSPGLDRFAKAHSDLSAAETEFKAELAETQRKAVIEQEKGTMVAAAGAQNIQQAEQLFASLKDKLAGDDPWIKGEGANRMGSMFAGAAKRLKDRNNAEGAMQMVDKGLTYAPALKELKDMQSGMAGEVKKSAAYNLASSATVQSVRGLPERLNAARTAIPAEQSTIQAETIKRLATRIKDLESSDVGAANDLWAVAKELFPNERTLTGLSVRSPPRPSQYTPRIRELIAGAKLSEAQAALNDAKAKEPNHEDVQMVERDLVRKQTEANQVFATFKTFMAQGNKPGAQTALSDALRRWSDNPTYLDEQRKNFAVTTAVAKAADGSKACLASIAGYGKQGRAECFDMPNGAKGPTLIVVPAGGGFATPFAIGKFEVTVAEYNAGCRAGAKCSAVAGEPALPATNMTLANAQAYAAWLAETTGKKYRVVSEAEWVYAANSTNPAAVKDFNCRVMQGDQVLKGLTMNEARTGSANPWGLTNYVGNAQEFVLKGGASALRGGAYTDSLSICGIDLVKPTSGNADPVTGFRVSRDID
jgi:serine/threonine protein kinase